MSLLTVNGCLCSGIVLISRFQAKLFISVVNKGTKLGTARNIVLFLHLNWFDEVKFSVIVCIVVDVI